jgi:hypothetical protein
VFLFLISVTLRDEKICFQVEHLTRNCHGSGGYSPASHRGGPDSRPGRSVWGLWWTVRHCYRVFSEFFGFYLSILFHRGSPYSYVTSGVNNKPVVVRSSETWSHPIDMNKNIDIFSS